MDNLLKVENLRRVDVRPGDRYVLLCKEHVSREQYENIYKTWKQFIGNDVPVLVLGNGAELGVIRTEPRG